MEELVLAGLPWGSGEAQDWQHPRAGDGATGSCPTRPFGWVSAGACACAGATCEDVLAPCAGGPCKNGGECRESEDYESFSCSCPSGWQGRGTALGLREGPDLPTAQLGGQDTAIACGLL